MRSPHPTRLLTVFFNASAHTIARVPIAHFLRVPERALQGVGDVRKYLKAYQGIFTPEQVRQMQDEMDRSAIPGETEEAVEERALKIIFRAQFGRVPKNPDNAGPGDDDG